MAARLQGPVRIVGTGLLGSSIGLGLSAKGVDVVLHDASPSQLRLAADYGAGRIDDRAEPTLVIVAVPPDVTARVVEAELAAHPAALVTDVASVKAPILTALRAAGADVSRYLGTHPMAGRERSGALAGRGDLFIGRPWVIADHPEVSYQQGALVDDLVLDLGGTPVVMSPDDHDRAVAIVSHMPQMVASLMAGLLEDAPEDALRLTGQGLRDTTRIAASDPALWMQILQANGPAVADQLRALRDVLDDSIQALDAPDAQGSPRRLADALARGNAGVARLPGKHGARSNFALVAVRVDDRPGELARLLTQIGDADINMEDVRLEHAEGAQFGVAEVLVAPESESPLVQALEESGWTVLS